METTWSQRVALVLSRSGIIRKSVKGGSEGGRLDANWLPRFHSRRRRRSSRRPSRKRPRSPRRRCDFLFFLLSSSFPRTRTHAHARLAADVSAHRFIRINWNILWILIGRGTRVASQVEEKREIRAFQLAIPGLFVRSRNHSVCQNAAISSFIVSLCSILYEYEYESLQLALAELWRLQSANIGVIRGLRWQVGSRSIVNSAIVSRRPSMERRRKVHGGCNGGRNAPRSFCRSKIDVEWHGEADTVIF